jgi:hypothetical protein
MAGELLDFDATIIERFAHNLYRKAELFTVGAVVIGVVVGAAFGAVPLTSLGEYWPVSDTFGFATMLIGALVGGVVGYVVGDARAFGYRLHAQVALCQIQIERTTAQTARLAATLAAAAAPRPDAPVAAAPPTPPTPAMPPVAPAVGVAQPPVSPVPVAASVAQVGAPPAPPLLRPPAAG